MIGWMRSLRGRRDTVAAIPLEPVDATPVTRRLDAMQLHIEGLHTTASLYLDLLHTLAEHLAGSHMDCLVCRARIRHVLEALEVNSALRRARADDAKTKAGA